MATLSTSLKTELLLVVLLSGGLALGSQLFESRLLAAQSNTWQYAAAFDQLRIAPHADSFFPEVAAAPIHGGLLWWLAKIPLPGNSLTTYGRAALGLGAFRVFWLWLAARLLLLPGLLRLAVVLLSTAAFISNPPQSSEPFTQAAAIATACSAATVYALRSGLGWASLLAGAIAGLTVATHLPGGFLNILLVTSGLVFLRIFAKTGPSIRQVGLATIGFVLLAWPMILLSLDFMKVPRSWEGQYEPWQAFTTLFSQPSPLDVTTWVGFAAFFLAAMVRFRRSPATIFSLGCAAAALFLALPPCQIRLGTLLNVSTASRVLLLFPAHLYLAERLSSMFSNPRFQRINLLLVLGAGLIVGALAVRQARWQLRVTAQPAHGFAQTSPELTHHLHGRRVLTDTWTAFTGRSYWGSYGIAYPSNHATTIAGSEVRRERVESFFRKASSPLLAGQLLHEYNGELLLVNHRFEQGETDPALGHGAQVPLEDFVRSRWTIVYQSDAYTILKPPVELSDSEAR